MTGLRQCRPLVSLIVFLCTAVAPLASASADLLFDLLPERQIDQTILGINAFVNDPRFGSISEQFGEVQNQLGIKYVRVLMAWTDDIQPTPQSKPFFGFYDDIVAQLKPGMRALVVVTTFPSWMNDPTNWISGDPRKTFVKRWVRRLAKRYRKKRKIIGFQIWNEPNDEGNPDNALMNLTASPSNYVEMLAEANDVIRKVAPKKKIISAATTSINQNYPETLQYNIALRELGTEALIDYWAVHFYGEQIYNVIPPDGIADTLNKLGKPIWITESGEKGVNDQLTYASKLWPFLREEIPGVARIFQYQFTEDTNASETYGLRNLTPGFEYSDLYLYLLSL